MSRDETRPEERAGRLLDYLRRQINDRGAMAVLRCALSPSAAKRSLAWPLLAPMGRVGDPVIETVAGLFAYHPQEAGDGNIGTTCSLIQKEHQSFDGRFRRLLSCDREEICERVRPVILAAKSKGIPVNYEALFVDLSYWGDKVKARWARKYWAAAGAEKPVAALSETSP